jgi:hypothetical protein
MIPLSTADIIYVVRRAKVRRVGPRLRSIAPTPAQKFTINELQLPDEHHRVLFQEPSPGVGSEPVESVTVTTGVDFNPQQSDFIRVSVSRSIVKQDCQPGSEQSLH